ncbi:MAG: hypothetical protein ABJP34_06530 [Erythrobacter sp.]
MSAPAAASGSGGGGGGFGGFGSGSSAGSQVSQADRLERRGKSQVRKRITCKKCEYNGKLNRQTAPEVAQAVRNGKFELNDKNRQAVLFYLRQRFGV